MGQPVFLSPLGDTSSIDGPVVSITEDRHGFIWLVDSNGLWRWDSHNLQAIAFENKNTAVSTPKIHISVADNNGQLWVGTQRGIYYLPQGSNTLIPFEQAQLSSYSVQLLSVTTVANENMMVFASDRSLFIFNDTQKHLQQVNIPNDSRIHALHIDLENKLWIGTENGLFYLSLSHVKNRNVTPKLLLNALDASSQPRISSIQSTQQGSLVVGTAADGLFVKNAQQDFRQITINADAQPWIYAIGEVQQNVLLLGTFGSGLVEVNLQTEAMRHFQHDRLQPAPLADNDIWTLFTDSRGLVWIAAGNKVNVYEASNYTVNTLFGGTNSQHGLQQRKAHSVQHFNDKLLVGTGNKGIEVLFTTNDNIAQWWPTSKNPVETLYISQQGQIYASSNFATVEIDPTTLTASPVSIGERKSTTFTSAFLIANDTLWLGGTDGLWAKRGGAEQYIALPKKVEERRIASLVANNDTLWIGSWQGLLKGPVDIDKIEPTTIVQIDHPILSQQYISSLYIDKHDRLWVGTGSAGIFVQDTHSTWQQINTKNGLPSNSVSAIAGESAQHIWLSTSRGITAIDQQSLSASTSFSGASAATINAPYARGAATITSSKHIAFGGVNGVTVIDSNAFEFTPSPLPLVLTNIDIITQNNTLESPSLVADSLVLAPLTKRIAFEFAALDYLTPEHIQYRYRIQGLDDNWTLVDAAHRTATVTTPPPGKYVLQIAYSHDGSHWENNTLRREIVVLPAWYQRYVTKFFAVLLLCIAGYLGHLLGVKHHRNRQAVLEERVNARTAQLLAANMKLSEQATALEAASLTDPLTGLHNRRFLAQHIERDVALVQRYYENGEHDATHPHNDSDLLFFIIDLDHFKRINDTYGHQAGDAVLVETQRRLKQIFRETDYLIRWGGEEFLVVVHNTPRNEACELAERVVNIIGKENFQLTMNDNQAVTCSIGFAAYPLSVAHYDMFDWQATIGLADLALYGAKNNNRNTWMGFTTFHNNADRTALEKVKRQPALIFEHAPVHTRSATAPGQ